MPYVVLTPEEQRPYDNQRWKQRQECEERRCVAKKYYAEDCARETGRKRQARRDDTCYGAENEVLKFHASEVGNLHIRAKSGGDFLDEKLQILLWSV